ncbi:MAG: TonB-dependent receptor, partial [Pedobacter sp.]
QSLKDYILSNEGKIAERNGGINKFFGIVDLRISKKIKLYKTHNIEISGDIFNVGNLIKKKWGVNETLGSQALYALGIPEVKNSAGVVTSPAVPNFDTTNKVFNYRVNNSGVVNPSGNPYQFQLGFRYGF